MALIQLGGDILGVPSGWVVGGGLIAFGLGVLSRIWTTYRSDPFQPWIDHVSKLTPSTIESSPDSLKNESSQVKDQPDEERIAELLQTAAERYSHDELRGAIQASYVAVQTHWTTYLDGDFLGTHQDFIDRCENEAVDIDLVQLRRLTKLYEQALFDPDNDPTSQEAARAFDLAVALTESNIQSVNDHSSSVDAVS